MTLLPLTDEARRSLGGHPHFQFTLPLRVGRESRAPRPSQVAVERRLQQMPPLNDLYLIHPRPPEGFQISRQHFMIEQVGSQIELTDLKSTCGTWVGDRPLGAGSPDSYVALQDGDVIAVGGRQSPYRYRFSL